MIQFFPIHLLMMFPWPEKKQFQRDFDVARVGQKKVAHASAIRLVNSSNATTARLNTDIVVNV